MFMKSAMKKAFSIIIQKVLPVIIDEKASWKGNQKLSKEGRKDQTQQGLRK